MKQKTAIHSEKQFLRFSQKRIISFILALFMAFSATYQTDLFSLTASAASFTKISDIISFKQNYNIEASKGSIVDLTPALPEGVNMVEDLPAKKSTSITEINISFEFEEAAGNVLSYSYHYTNGYGSYIDAYYINYDFAKDPSVVIGKKYRVEAEVSANNGTSQTYTFYVTIVSSKDTTKIDEKAQEIKDSITYPTVVTIFPDSINGRSANVYPTTKNGVTLSTESNPQINPSGDLTTIGCSMFFSYFDESVLSINWFTGEVKYAYTGDVSKVDGYESVFDITVNGDNGGVFQYSVILKIQTAFAEFDDSTSALLEIGEKSQAILRVSPEYRDITWESSDPTVLSVKRNADKTTAQLTAKKSGSATITAYVTNDREIITVSRTYLVNVAPPAPKISISSAALKKGEVINLYINNLPDKATVTYTTSKSSVASVGKTTGKVTTKAAGTATITATVKVPANGAVKAATYKLKCKVTVTTAAVKSISTAQQLRTALTSGKGGSYKLTKSINLGKTGIEIKSGAYRLNLNGYKITGATVDPSRAVILIKGGSLVLTDSKGTGVIRNASEWPAVMNNSSTFIMYGGTLSGKSQAFQCVGTSGKSTINGGKMIANDNVIIPGAGRLTVNYAELTSGINDEYYTSCFGTARDKLNLTINGGKFKSEIGIDCEGDFATIVINGGTFDTTCYTAMLYSSALTVNGGKMNNGIVMNEWIFAENVPRLTINNCDIKTVNSCPIQINNRTNLTLNGGRLENLSTASDEILNIDRYYSGVKNIAEGLLSKDEILDATPEGQGISVTSFKRNKTKYTKGMHITKPNDLYSVWMDIFENLYTDISFTCTPSMDAVMDYYISDWIDHTGSVFRNMDSDLDKVSLDATITYNLEYMIHRLGVNPALKSRASKEAIAYSQKLDAIIKSCIKSGMTDKEKIIALHDYMIKHYSYDYSYSQESYSYLGLIDNNTGVCQAFATMLQELASRCGIKAATVTGYAGEPGGTLGAHMWNCVQIGGKNYYIDVTFDENFTTGDKPSRQFCLLSENDFYNLGYHSIVFGENWQ
ncbi:MAG: Ig-like domain-containing protein [Oscillospiraceae bacterium]|nr:Ig-like domain-containing protein [Oscillospiraceae bacterium]